MASAVNWDASAATRPMWERERSCRRRWASPTMWTAWEAPTRGPSRRWVGATRWSHPRTQMHVALDSARPESPGPKSAGWRTWCGGRQSRLSTPRELSATTASAGAHQHHRNKAMAASMAPDAAFCEWYWEPLDARSSQGTNINTLRQRRRCRIERTSPWKCNPGSSEGARSIESAVPGRPAARSMASLQRPENSPTTTSKGAPGSSS